MRADGLMCIRVYVCVSVRMYVYGCALCVYACILAYGFVCICEYVYVYVSQVISVHMHTHNNDVIDFLLSNMRGICMSVWLQRPW